MREHLVPNKVFDMPIAKYMKRAYPMILGRALKDALKKRDIRINGIKSGEEATVSSGDIIKTYIPDKELGIYTLNVLYENEQILVAVKPSGLPTDRDEFMAGEDTFISRAKAINENARLVNRLDTYTSGVMILALNDDIEEILKDAFKNHTIDKRYEAIVIGVPPKTATTRFAYLKKDKESSLVTVSDKKTPGSVEIITEYKTVKTNGKLSKVELKPVTGKTHQLRAHMAHLNYPILGDDKYGDRNLNKKYNVSNTCLNCYYMELPTLAGLGSISGMSFTYKQNDPEGIKWQ